MCKYKSKNIEKKETKFYISYKLYYMSILTHTDWSF